MDQNNPCHNSHTKQHNMKRSWGLFLMAPVGSCLNFPDRDARPQTKQRAAMSFLKVVIFHSASSGKGKRNILDTVVGTILSEAWCDFCLLSCHTAWTQLNMPDIAGLCYTSVGIECKGNVNDQVSSPDRNAHCWSRWGRRTQQIPTRIGPSVSWKRVSWQREGGPSCILRLDGQIELTLRGNPDVGREDK